MVRLLFIIIILLPLWATQAQETLPEPESSFCVSVWFPSSEHPDGYASLSDRLDMIDVINPFWYAPLPDGRLQAVNNAEDEAKLAAWREAGKPVLPSIFTSVSGVIETEELRAVHIDEIVALVEQMDYDGIDIDYEGFARHTREPFALFIEALSQALHANDRLLSVTVHPKTSDEGTWESQAAQDWARLAPAADIFNIMTYDYTSRNRPPGPIAPTPWVLDVLAYADQVTDLSKVRLGLPFYAYLWQRGTPPAQAGTWEGVMRWAGPLGAEIERDPVDMEAFVRIKPPGLPLQVAYFADAASLRFKMEQVHALYPDLGGIAIWGIGGEDPANWEVLHTLRPADCTPPSTRNMNESSQGNA
jgi:spore germination protein